MLYCRVTKDGEVKLVRASCHGPKLILRHLIVVVLRLAVSLPTHPRWRLLLPRDRSAQFLPNACPDLDGASRSAPCTAGKLDIRPPLRCRQGKANRKASSRPRAVQIQRRNRRKCRSDG